MSVASPKSATPKPNRGESYTRFVYRAHSHLRPVVKDTYARNAMVWDAWHEENGNNLRDRARAYFPSDKYRIVENVPYFMEHTIQKATGPLTYDFTELSRMVDHLNNRCASDSYSALVSHHTDDGKKGPEHEPSVLGFSGPFAMGMVPSPQGDKWAIFGHEFHDRNYSSVLNQRRRRSVEVLRPRNGDPSYFDPIATLGADSPRLPLPVARYSADEAGAELVGVYSITGTDTERYMMSAGPMSAVGQGNTYIPGTTPQRDKYEVPPSPGSMTEDQGMLGGQGMPDESAGTQLGGAQITPQDVAAIVNALMETPQMKWVSEQMEAGQSPMQMQPGGAPEMGAPPSAPSPMPSAPPQAPPTPYSASPVQQPPAQPRMAYSATSQEDDEMSKISVEDRYAAIETELMDSRDRYAQLEQSHTSLAQANESLFKQHADLMQAFSLQNQKLADADRYSAIRDLAQKYSTIELDYECEKCLYSKGSKLSDEQFSERLADLERYAQRAENTPPRSMIPEGVMPKPIDPDNAAKLSYLVVERYTADARKGRYRQYDEIEVEIKKELGLEG